MGWWAVRVTRTVAVLAATGLLAGCLGASSGGTSGTSTSGANDSGTDNRDNGGNGYGGNGGSANGSNGGVGGNGGNGYGGQGSNGYGGSADGADGKAGAPGGSFSDPDAVAGSSRLTSRKVDLSHVTAVVASANFVVHLRMGGPAQATVTMDDNLTDRIEATVTGDELHLGIKPGMSVRNATLSADVTVGRLDRLATSGASRVTLAPAITSPALELIVSGSSAVSGALRSGQVQATLSGASTLALTGQVQDLRCTASGASQLPLSGLTVRRLDAMLSGASHATVTVTDSVAAQTAGASVLRYRGNPNVTRSQTSGMSSIVRDSP